MTNDAMDEATYRQQLAWMRERFAAKEYAPGYELAVIEETASRLDEAVRLLERWATSVRPYSPEGSLPDDTRDFLRRVRP